MKKHSTPEPYLTRSMLIYKLNALLEELPVEDIAKLHESIQRRVDATKMSVMQQEVH